MSAYIDGAFYLAYTGESVLPDGFSTLAARASDIIDVLTFNRIPQSGGLGSYPAWVQEAVKKATAAQVQQLEADGGSEAMTGAAYQNVTVGKFSYGAGQWSGGAGGIGGINVASLVRGYLAPTGLLYRGLDCGC